jgi:type I restriction enzyme S subunit
MSVPQLRFKEFDGEWVENSLGYISENVMYGMNAAAIPFDGVNKYIRITDIDEDSREFKPSPISSPNGEIEDKYKLKEGDIVFARTGASVGKSYLYNTKDGNLFFAGFLIKFSIVKAHPYFIFTKTLTNAYKGWVTVMSMRSGQPGVNAEEFKEFRFLAPEIPEQTKIANFLTAVDEKITHLTQKHTLLTQYKKGVMQQIFSQQLRFKDDDGLEFPEWKEKSLGEVTCFIKDGTHGTHLDTVNGDYLLLSAKNIRNGGIYFDDSDRRISKTEFQSIFKNYTLCNGDVLLSVVGTIGRVAIYSSAFSNVAFQRSVAFFRFENDNSLFIAQLFTANKFQNDLVTNQVVSAQAGIYLGDLAKIKINLPCIQEQTKIANFLTAIDDKLTTVQTQLNAMKQYKQGLLQQMFV